MDERTKKYLEARARPLEKKTVTFKIAAGKNHGLKETQEIVAGKCPCSICGHEWMWQCEEANGGNGCDCCSSACT